MRISFVGWLMNRWNLDLSRRIIITSGGLLASLVDMISDITY